MLGASNYTFAEATWSQGLEDWIGSHQRAFTFLGGVPEIIVPDNLQSGISKAHTMSLMLIRPTRSLLHTMALPLSLPGYAAPKTSLMLHTALLLFRAVLVWRNVLISTCI